MKKFFIVFLCVLTFALAGCGDKQLPAAKILRDDQRIGGSLSFVYDKQSKMIYVGGDGEVVQFSSAREELGLEEGNRIGLKIIAPDESLNLEDASLQMHGVNYSSGEFLETINGQKQRFFNIYPLVSKEDEEICFSVKWQEGTKKQDYKIVVVKGTKFMDKDGNVQ